MNYNFLKIDTMESHHDSIHHQLHWGDMSFLFKVKDQLEYMTQEIQIT